jgi:hypothetical protein
LVLVQDPGTVVWANTTRTSNALNPTQNAQIPRPQTPRFDGAWVGGTAYTGSSGTSTNDIVTNGGITYMCYQSTNLTLSQALQNSTVTLGSATTVANASFNTTVYTVASGVTASMVGQQFIVTGLNPSNNGTFICTATAGTTSITLSNPIGTSQAGASGTIASAATVLSFIGTINGGAGNGLVGYSFINTGFSNSGNNITYTVTSSSAAGLACTATGTNESHAAVATSNTAPTNDNIYWVPYYYEVYRTNDLQNPPQNISAVSVSGTVTTYTLSGATSNYTVGEAVTIAGFSNSVNNGTFVVTTVTGTASFTVATVAQTNETHAATVYNCDNPLYFQLVYSTLFSVVSGGSQAVPNIFFSAGTLCGTGLTTGFMAGNQWNSNGLPPITPIGSQSGTASTNGFECNFQSTDGGSFSVMMFRDPTSGTISPKTQVFFADRARSTTGSTLDAYWFVGTAVGLAPVVQTLFKNGMGSVCPGSGPFNVMPAIAVGTAGRTAIMNGLVPVYPVFPIVGYIGNPTLQVILMQATDCVEGQLIVATLYGSAHTYLVTKAGTNSGPSNAAQGFGIRWE